ncbi:MAG: Asp-tRNA(Asn)/Glu-tRNA(Gln) amidotransferase subunit GatB [bacterium]|nr:Asp-tRNA(Asn)/Glu-tRNA(Gln) amidotransferase subunit GatB [bacterium]
MTKLPFQYVIGLEIHVQLKTKSKMFCRCSNEGENAPPNTTICPVCMGHPGTMPVMNETAVLWSAKTSLALNCEIKSISKFDRKNYFYPDLPKGYQISQYDQPIGSGGYIDIEMPDAPEGQRKEAHIRLNRLHLEEDAAKLVHAPGGTASLVDFNRSSTPLMEIVSEPDMASPLEAKTYLQEIRMLVRALDVSHADMEKGHMRCDANVSIKFEHNGTPVWSPISEIKNLNSFKAVEKALEYEANRIYNEWQHGGEVTNRKNKITVGWDDSKEETILQRSKEEAHDYRYFPEPDLPPLYFSEIKIQELRAQLPELPMAQRHRLVDEYSVSAAEAHILVEDADFSQAFEEAASEVKELLPVDSHEKAFKLLSGLLINKVAAILAEHAVSLGESKITPHHLAELVAALAKNTINSTTATAVLAEMFATGASPIVIIKEKGLEQVTDTAALETACDAALAANPDAVVNYKVGKTTVIMFLVGQVMREMKGKAQPESVKEILEKKLTNN